MSAATSTTSTTKRALVVYGPTAAGKSGLADRFAEGISEARGAWAPVLVVDSMQVYREVPVMTNQARSRPAEMVGIVSVAEEWSVARHKESIEGLVAHYPETPFVLDAGTGMYLNAIVLDVSLAPRVPADVRAEAEKFAAGEQNPRRAAREAELGLVGEPERDSIWAGGLRYDAAFVYLRPPRDALDRQIAARSAKIMRDGAGEARELLQAMDSGELAPNPSVRQAIGVREMLDLVAGNLSAAEAEERVNARTRRLARRQMRWFDKLARHLAQRLPRERLRVVESAAEAEEGCGEDIMGAWTRMG